MIKAYIAAEKAIAKIDWNLPSLRPKQAESVSEIRRQLCISIATQRNEEFIWETLTRLKEIL